jgi:hypothetical protein
MTLDIAILFHANGKLIPLGSPKSVLVRGSRLFSKKVLSFSYLLTLWPQPSALANIRATAHSSLPQEATSNSQELSFAQRPEFESSSSTSSELDGCHHVL